eukprot:jgi/Botrbrau1/11880/Bobra.126_2s0014.2
MLLLIANWAGAAQVPGPSAAPLESLPEEERNVTTYGKSNLAFALTAGSATFGPNNTLYLGGLAPAVTYFATVPVYHAGNLNTSFFLSGNLSYNGSWLGNPDAALLGSLNGSQVVVLLSIGSPLQRGRIATFKAFHLTSEDQPLLQGGPVAAFFRDLAVTKASGSPARILTTVSGATRLRDVSLVVDSAMTESTAAHGLKSVASTTATNDGFTYDCRANTPWKPIWCGSFGGFGGPYRTGLGCRYCYG